MIRLFSGLISFLFLQLILVSFPTEAPCPWIWTPESGRFTNENSISKTTPKEQYDVGKDFQKKKSYPEAIREYRKLIKTFPTSSLAVYAQIGVAECEEKRRDYYAAFKEYQKVLENYPSYGRIFDIIENQFKIGNVFLTGGKRKLWKFNIVPARDKAIEVFQQVIENAPFSEYAPRSQFLLGECYFKMKKYTEAIAEYQQVVEDYSESEYVDDARFQIGHCAYLLSRGPQYDQQATDKALKTFSSFIADFPASRRVDEAKKMMAELQTRKAEGLFDVAEYYWKQKIYASAQIYYQDVIKSYPNSSLSKKSQKRLLEIQNSAITEQASVSSEGEQL